MSTTILIAPYEGPLAAAIAAEARGAGHRLVLARRAGPGAPRFGASGGAAAGESPAAAARDESPTAGAARSEEAARREIELSWNPASYVSVGALLLEARGAVGEIDLAVILGGTAPATAGGLLDGAPGPIAARVEEDCLGPALLARELARRFAARGSGRLALVAAEPFAAAGGAPSGGAAAADPLGAIAAGAFRGLGEGLFALAKEASWACFGLVDGSGQPESAARFALKLLDEGKSAKSGRWLRYTGKSGLFGVF